MRHKPKRRLSVQNLENRRLFAADIGVSEAPYGPGVPAMVGSIRPTKVDRPVFGPVSESCPPCQLEGNGEASEMDAEPKPTKIEAGRHEPHSISFFSGSANDGSANLGGSSDPGGDDV